MSLRVSKQVGNVTVHAEGADIEETFYSLAALTEAFGEDRCGCCGEKNLIFRVRKVDSDGEKYSFPELVCSNMSCRAKLSYGKAKEGNVLYPKRIETTKKGQPIKDENGKVKYLPNNGWEKYDPSKKEE